MQYVVYPLDPLVSAAVISNASIRGCSRPEFWSAIAGIAMGASWDLENDARIMAILALPRGPEGCDEEKRKILARCANDQNPVVSDTAVIAAQRCLNIPEGEILMGRGEGNLKQRVRSDVVQWLSLPFE